MKHLVLIRHGKPEPGREGVPDALRELTPEGRAALAADGGFRATFSKLEAAAGAAGIALGDAASVALWTSPAVRARQTADEARRALERMGLRVAAPIERAALWEQDEAVFLEDVLRAESEAVIACGHIPFMNRMAAWLTGREVSFNPGAAALIALPDEVSQGEATLVSFVPGPTV